MGEHSYGNAVCGMLSHPLFLIILVGLVVRTVLSATLTYCYDVSYWGYIIENVESGNGLYGLPGYYYTPVWGYIVMFLGVVANGLFGISEMGFADPSLVPALGANWDFYTDLVMTPAMVAVFKAFFTAVDLAISWILYRMVLERTGDRRKAYAAFGLWFLCPIVIYTSCVQAMFDPVTVLLLVMAVYLTIHRSYFLAGMALAMSVFCKFFSGYLALLFLAYVYVAEGRDRRAFARGAGAAVLGVLVMTVMVFIPNILNGTLEDAFLFILNRVDIVTDVAEDGNLWDNISSLGYTLVMALQVVIVLLEVYLAVDFARRPHGDLSDAFMKYGLLASTAVFLWTPTPTYLLIIIPFLVYHLLVSDRRFRIPYLLLATMPMLYSLVMNGAGILFQSAVFTDLVSAETVLSIIDWLDATTAGVTHQDLLNIAMGVAETVAIYSVFAVHLLNRRAERAAEAVR